MKKPMRKEKYLNETDTPSKLPLGKLLAFTMVGFLTIMTENVPAGLLLQISHSLDVSQSMAGQMVTLYALGSVVAVIPIVLLTRSWNRRPLFLMAIGGLFLFNMLTVVVLSYEMILAARFFAGMGAGVVWGVMAGYARRLAPAHLQGRALAIAGLGQPIALSIGVPMGAWLGDVFEWQTVFWGLSVLAFIMLVWIRLIVPDISGQVKKDHISLNKVLLIPGVRPILFVLFTWILAHNILYTYISPFVASTNSSVRIDVLLLLFGGASLIGIFITGMFVDRFLRCLGLTTLSLFAFSIGLLLVFNNSNSFLIGGILCWGMSFGGAPVLLQAALTKRAKEHTDAAQSILVTIFNIAVAGGGIVGAVIIENFGDKALPVSLLPLIVIALVVSKKTL
ncbi:MFS transporter [Alteromonas sp. 5E99-2]|uniref:MFS transporter n=1 Tax=Alteromonas sp. 5E99-2 TaxID=2817683 RepID=UPI001A98842A|nr:MFS transporter [Alteromonas sp. 5E99-2]MBO1255460.1 MFS transporter [Alteromonas sp. 5E99-2]